MKKLLLIFCNIIVIVRFIPWGYISDEWCVEYPQLFHTHALVHLE